MHDAFTPLARWLQPPAAVDEKPPRTIVENANEEEEAFAFDDVDDALSEARRFRAALADAIDCAAGDLLVTIASAVLGRELLLAPVDVRRIVESAIEDDAREVVRVRVHPSDRPACDGAPYAVCVDDTLRPGDAVLEMSHGTIDARLGTRLARVLA